MSDNWASPVSSNVCRCLSNASFLTERCDLVLKMRHGVHSTAGIIRVRLVHLVEVAVEALVDSLQALLQIGPCEAAVSVVHSLDARAVHGNQLAPVQIQFTAQPHELAKHGPGTRPYCRAESPRLS